MTDKQIKQQRSILNKKYYWDNPHTQQYLLRKWTKKDLITEKELWCREMINSILLYYWSRNCLSSEYLKRHILELWEEKVKKLYNEQLEDFKKAKINYHAWEDSEWWTYYWIKRHDEN